MHLLRCYAVTAVLVSCLAAQDRAIAAQDGHALRPERDQLIAPFLHLWMILPTRRSGGLFVDRRSC
jgi:hypothetical protein